MSLVTKRARSWPVEAWAPWYALGGDVGELIEREGAISQWHVVFLLAAKRNERANQAVKVVRAGGYLLHRAT